MKKIILSIVLLITVGCINAQSPWYHHTTIYQIYPRSYYDSNGDGIGDIQGIIQKLDYIQSLGFETIWCSPFFKSPQKDFGYDISDYCDIASEYGTTADALQLINEVHKRGMKIVFDMVMNHTSDEHIWFKKDLQRPLEQRSDTTDFYLWRSKPNNWKSMVSGSAWHYNKERGQYYYAAFLPFQPDLNYRNPAVKKAMLDNARFWLAKGVDGFRLDIFNSVYEDSLCRNNPVSLNFQTQFRKPVYTANLPESLGFAEELRAVCDSFGDKLLVGEIVGNRNVSRAYCGEKVNNRLTLAFDFEMLRFRYSARYFDKLIHHLETDFADPFMPVYVFSNHDRRRGLSRLKGSIEKVKLLHTMQLTLRGVPCVYYGEEIGMTDLKLPYKTALDPIPHYLKIPRAIMNLANETLNRDELRTPMQWNSFVNAGFSSASKTWLPVHTDFANVNVEKEINDRSSLLFTFVELLKIRKEYPSFRYGELRIIDSKVLKPKILAYNRIYGKEETSVLLNFGNTKKKLIVEKNCNVLFADNAVYDSASGKASFNKYGVLILKK